MGWSGSRIVPCVSKSSPICISCTTGDDMPALLLVPGVGGSEIYTPPSFFGLGPPIRVWLNYASMVAGAWRWLALGPDGRTPTFPGVGSLDAGPLVEPYYSTAVNWFSSRGYRVFQAQNFWLGVLESDAETLAAQIVSLSGEAPIHCLAHSRGGLVLRRALQILAASNQLGLVGRCAGLGVPHQGSWESANLLAGFQRSLERLCLLVQLGPFADWADSGCRALQAVVRTWPVAYQLMPALNAVGVPPATIAMLYQAAAWAGIGIEVSQAWLTEASEYWTGFGPVPAAVQWVDVVGMGLSTPDQLVSVTPPQSPASYTYTELGDGVVPARWATQFGRFSITTPTAHSSLVTDGRVLAALDDFYREGIFQNVVIGGPVLP